VPRGPEERERTASPNDWRSSHASRLPRRSIDRSNERRPPTSADRVEGRRRGPHRRSEVFARGLIEDDREQSCTAISAIYLYEKLYIFRRMDALGLHRPFGRHRDVARWVIFYQLSDNDGRRIASVPISRRSTTTWIYIYIYIYIYGR